MKRVTRNAILLSLAGLALAFAWLARRAAADRVSLDVRNATLASVVQALRWQTWERIHIAPGKTELITLNVWDIPLTEALELVAEQAGCQFQVVFPLHRSGATVRQWVAAVTSGATNSPGWANLFSASAPGAAGRFAANTGHSGEGLSMALTNRPVAEAARALSRFGRSRVISADELQSNVSLTLANVTMEQAVTALARQARAKWSKHYVLKPFHRPGPHFPPGDVTVAPPGPRGDQPFDLPAPGPDMVRIPFNGPGPGGAVPLPPDLPPPDPEAMQRSVSDRVAESLRNSTPEARAERWRQSRSGPPPGLRPR